MPSGVVTRPHAEAGLGGLIHVAKHMDVPGKGSCLQRKCLTTSENRLAALPQAGEATWSSEEKKPVVKVKVGAPLPFPPPGLKEQHLRGGFLLGKGVAGSSGQLWKAAALSPAPAPLSGQT